MNGKKIDAIQFIQDKENISKHEAIKKSGKPYQQWHTVSNSKAHYPN
jgi:hypothetical protein